MNEKAFFDLVKDNSGFEFAIGFNGEIHYIGGKDNKVWYFIDKGKTDDYYVATVENGQWQDYYYELKNYNLTRTEVEPGTTIKMIVDRAGFRQKKIRDSERRPTEIKIKGYDCLHYVSSRGKKNTDILKDYGITVSFTDKDNPKRNYRFWDLAYGEKVKAPRER